MPRIDEMFAFVAEESGPDDEGLIGFKSGDSWIPMVGADMARVNSLKPVAKQISKITGKSVKVLRFTNREEIEEICPDTD